MKRDLVLLRDVGAPLHLDHLDFFEYPNAVASLDQQDDIASAKNTALEIILFRIVEVNPKPSFPNKFRALEIQNALL
jgi:hypothetical protein